MTITIGSQRDANEKVNGKKITDGVRLSNQKDIIIENVDFVANESDQAMLHLSDCQGCIVRKSKFHDKNTLGVGLKIDGSKSKDNIVEDSDFYNLTYSAGNGGEPIRLGNSRQGYVFFNTTIRRCTFKNLAADAETISIKSCGNLVELCKHENCKSSIVIRHGHTNTIRANEFIGEGGIRVYGKDNKIIGNIHKDNKSSNFPQIGRAHV